MRWLRAAGAGGSGQFPQPRAEPRVATASWSLQSRGDLRPAALPCGHQGLLLFSKCFSLLEPPPLRPAPAHGPGVSGALHRRRRRRTRPVGSAPAANGPQASGRRPRATRGTQVLGQEVGQVWVQGLSEVGVRECSI